MSLAEEVKNIQRKYLNNEDISIDLANLFIKLSEQENQTLLPSITNSETRRRLNNADDVNKVAYFIALYDHNEITSEKRPTPALRVIAEKLKIKPNTLRNKRDMFVPYTNKKRKEYSSENGLNLKIKVGWDIEKPLSKELQKTYDECISKTHDELLHDVRHILGLKEIN